MTTKREYISHAELARVLDVAEAALHRRRSVGQAPAGELRVIPGMPAAQYRYAVDDVRAFIREQRDEAVGHFRDCEKRLREAERGR